MPYIRYIQSVNADTVEAFVVDLTLGGFDKERFSIDRPMGSSVGGERINSQRASSAPDVWVAPIGPLPGLAATLRRKVSRYSASEPALVLVGFEGS